MEPRLLATLACGPARAPRSLRSLGTSEVGTHFLYLVRKVACRPAKGEGSIVLLTNLSIFIFIFFYLVKIILTTGLGLLLILSCLNIHTCVILW